MKKLLALLLFASMLFSLSACGSTGSEGAEDISASPAVSEESEISSTPAADPSPEAEPSETTEESAQSMRIKLSTNGETAIVELADNDAAKDLVSMLPMTLSFEDYNSTEKISVLPRELNIGGAATSCDPDIGSFAYYAPWGNLSIFYEDFRESEGLIPLGTFIEGIDIFAEAEGEFTVVIESEENK